MNLRLFLFTVLAALGATLGCDPRGISVGTEELCDAEPELALAQATSDEQVSTCARIGENQLANAGFETPLVDCTYGSYCQFPAAELGGWETTSADQVIEVWRNGHMDVPAAAGNQFVELNAKAQDTLAQEVASVPGQLMYWSLLHRGRNGLESVAVRIGPPEATVRQAVLKSDADAWYPYSGLYRIGDAELITRFELVSLTPLAEGNLIDDVVFAPVD